ncbi:dihydrodipicolinate synthase [Arboricoccus pini]|uniref:4-hydroxy-tetrahydrodipicolinate synthase n=1 Tax=Arboricoccus pini TaxID=1963835 RepID=A0A212QPX9_9PROT|nr:4-hydroxy-tetrahydrodipicolinate synthase [Arboricoccus pini]SNB61344.1 dihydrodipicolinate synthase [Arboricoccus pini]
MFKGSIVALVTPFNKDGSVDAGAFKDLIEWHLQEGTDGFVPVGTTGESPTLSHEEHGRVIELCVEATAGRAPVIAGAGSNATREAISLTRHAKDVGADAALIVTPYYNKPSQEGLYRHYSAIAEAVDLPILIYNIPGRSVIDMSPQTMGRLAKLHGIVGVKDASADIVRPLLTSAACGPDFCQLSGEDANIVAFLAHGGHGCISVTANVAPGLCAALHDAWAAGRPEEALAIHRRLLPLHRSLFCEPSPSPAKYALSKLGKLGPGVRLPLVEASLAAQGEIDAAMAAAGILAR